MQVFYAPDIKGEDYVLDETESKHTIRVMRMKKGSPVKLIDGKGNLFEGVITDPNQRRCVIRVESVINNFETRNYRLHIAISPVKNSDRFEWFIEKSVEIGVDEITPLICANTEKSGIRSGRLRSIIISAMKQSLKSKETILNEPVNFGEFIKDSRKGVRMVAYCGDIKRKSIPEIYHRGDDAVILIGPEGDFSSQEVTVAISNNYLPVHLGTSRLRTETAGIAACHSVYLINQ